jgi:hypothetical protein
MQFHCDDCLSQTDSIGYFTIDFSAFESNGSNEAGLWCSAMAGGVFGGRSRQQFFEFHKGCGAVEGRETTNVTIINSQNY